MYTIQKEKQNDTGSNANFNWRNKESGKWCHKSTTEKKQHNDKYNCTIMHKGTEDIISGSQWQLPHDVEIKHVKLVNFNKIIKKLHRSEGHSVN